LLKNVGSHIRGQWIGVIALFVALGTGGAYAANTIGSGDIIDNSVQSADLKNNDVRTQDVRDASLNGGGLIAADIADDALTGAQIDESSLGVVPAASKLGAWDAGELATDGQGDSRNPNPDTALTSTPTTVLETTIHSSAAFAPVLIASLDVFSTSGSGQARCQFFSDGFAQGQAGYVDFGLNNDDEQLPLVAIHGYAGTPTGSSGYAPDFDIKVEVRCTEESGNVLFDRGDFVVVALPFSP
jgi:hypothetical protein